MIKLNQILTENNVLNYLKTLTTFKAGETQSNYFAWLYKQARPIQIVSYKKIKNITPKINEFLKHYSCQKKECYQTAFNCSQRTKIDYVEGYVLVAGIIPTEHAWNHYNGLYFDLTQEILWKEEKIEFSDYVKILTLNANDAAKYTYKNKVYGNLIASWYKDNILKDETARIY